MEENKLIKRKDGPSISKDLDKIEPIEITNKIPLFNTAEQLRKWIFDQIGNTNEIKVRETGQSIAISKSGIRRDLKRMRSQRHNQVYAEIVKIIESAKYLGFKEADDKHKSKVKGQDIFLSSMRLRELDKDGNEIKNVYYIEFSADVPLLEGNEKLNYAGHKITIPARDKDLTPFHSGDNGYIQNSNKKSKIPN
jgi:hypothetical protein